MPPTLNVCSPSTERKHLRATIVDVKEIIGEMAVLLRVEADRHSITIHPELEADAPKTLANSVQLQQVFMNLMLETRSRP